MLLFVVISGIHRVNFAYECYQMIYVCDAGLDSCCIGIELKNSWLGFFGAITN